MLVHRQSVGNWQINKLVWIKKQKFLRKVMVGLGECGAEDLTTPVIFEDGTIRNIEEFLPVACKCGNKMLGSHWTYQ